MIVVSREITEIAAADHVDSELVHAIINDVAQDMNDAGWECHFSLTLNGSYLVQDKPVTTMVGTEFEVHLNEADCDLMAGIEQDTVFLWTIQLKNSTLPRFYRREKDLEIKVRRGWVTV